ncbi:MAG: hypothetical protein ACR2KI_05130 [Candidatus Limnocylindria bacterium]
MRDVAFVIAGYGVILGGLAIYALILGRRLRNARREASSVAEVPAERDAEQPSVPSPSRGAE